MSKAIRIILAIVGILVIGAILVGAGFWLGQSTGLTNGNLPGVMRQFFPNLQGRGQFPHEYMMRSFSVFSPLGMIFNLIITVVLIAGAVLLVVWLVRGFSSRGSNTAITSASGGIQTPREILQMRYARGEITREQYQQMLSDMQ